MAAMIKEIIRSEGSVLRIAIQFPGGAIYHYGEKLSEFELNTMAEFLGRGCVGLTRWMMANNIMPRWDGKE